MLADLNLFERKVPEFISALRLQGVSARLIERGEAHVEGWWAGVASLGRGQPKIGIWLDRVLGGRDRTFWYGFYAPTMSMSKFIGRIMEVYDPYVSYGKYEIQELAAKEWMAVETDAYEQYCYFGCFAQAFASDLPAGTLEKRAAGFLRDVSETVFKPTGGKDYPQLINARRGQGEFRQRLLNRWGGCSVTGIEIPAVVRASHVKPWSLSTYEQRLDPDNGLLLTATLDALFDRHLISFEDDGSMVVPDDLASKFEAILPSQRALTQSLNTKQASYMAYHRSFFQRTLLNR